MRLRLFLSALAWAAAFVETTAEPLAGPRTFTDVFGRSLRAEIVELRPAEVVMRRLPDGSTFTLALDRLSDTDQEFLEKNRAAIVEALTPLPETAFTAELRRDFRVLKRSGLAVEPAPATRWTKTRYFVVVYGMSHTPEASALFAKILGDLITQKIADRPVAILWLGPSNPNGEKPPPLSEGDLKLAQILPREVAVVGVDAVARDGALVDAEIQAIANEESPGNPGLFFQSYPRRHRSVIDLWHARVKTKIASYWPDLVYRPTFQHTQGRHARVVDREGKPVLDADGRPLEGRLDAMVAAAAALTENPQSNVIASPPQ